MRKEQNNINIENYKNQQKNTRNITTLARNALLENVFFHSHTQFI